MIPMANQEQPQTLFGVPVQPAGGELVPYVEPATRGRAQNVSPPLPPGPAVQGASVSQSEATEPETVDQIRRVQADRERLVQQCRSNRLLDRCPRRCVLTGELRDTSMRRASGMDVFDDLQ